MKLIIISDVHSNIYALNEIILHEKTADLIICAGDLVDYGTEPQAVIDLFKSRNILTVSGNHDNHLIDIYDEGKYNDISPANCKWVHENCKKLKKNSVDYLRELPNVIDEKIDGIRYTIKHMYKGYDVIESLCEFDDYILSLGLPLSANSEEHRLIFGHRHRRGVYHLSDNRLWLNPGSVSYRRPDDNDKSAHYIVIINGVIHQKSVSYNRKPLLDTTEKYIAEKSLMLTELQDARFFFGNASTTRDTI